MGALDLLGVLAIGVLGALAAANLQSKTPGEGVTNALNLIHINDLTFQAQAIVLGLGAVLLLITRTILSIVFTRKILFFLSYRGAKISAELISRLLSQSILKIQSRTTQETLYAITSGVSIITMQILAITVVLVSDLSLLLIMMVGLFVVDSTTAIFTTLFFSSIGVLLYLLLHSRAAQLGAKNSLFNVQSNEKIVEVFSSYRELVVRNRRDYYSREIGKLRVKLADAVAEQNFMPYISKYIIETAVLLGAVLISSIQFILNDASQAISTLAIFLAAGTRITPAILRVQQSAITIRAGLGAAKPTLALIEELGNEPMVENTSDEIDFSHEGFISKIEIKNISFRYPKSDTHAVSKISLSIPVGGIVAIVGPSGAGKTTLIDLILGVLDPDEGSVQISELSPLHASAKWPGAISYVPQDILIAAGSIRENVALGYPTQIASDELVSRALSVADLNGFVSKLPNGINSDVGERGTRISGGERQRLGIARAMFTQPRLLVMDEATSSLDGETEASISKALLSLGDKTTVVLIAHRLSTIRNANMVVYISDGEIKAVGTFQEVRMAIPDFDKQANLLGL